mgnify:CR=1 FL=1
MWYVNKFNKVKIELDQYSFILTMWYVNSLETIGASFLLKGFILTMWYVNIIENGDFKIVEGVLY